VAIVYVPGSVTSEENDSNASFLSRSVGHNSISWTIRFVNGSNNTQTYEVGGSGFGITHSGTVPRNGSRNVSGTYTIGENSTGNVVGNKYGSAGALLSQCYVNYTTGFSYDDTPAPPPTPAPSFTDTTVANGLLGVSYSDGVAANNTSSYAIASGSLPSGLSLNTSTGAITGTPTGQGSFTFAINASGGGGTTGSGNLTIQILPPGNRRNDVGFDVNLANAKRYDGSAWVNLSTMKRFDGTNWVNISN
jgi:hypothetical protein